MLSLGIDLGSSSVKVTIYDPVKARVLASGQHPESEMEIIARRAGWAEQQPAQWWEAFITAFLKAVKRADIDPARIECIGISYQMHGLVCLDENGDVLRPSIIWCDSRAVEIGREALKELGEAYAFQHLLNSPGNFTASKLAWVKRNEPQIFERIAKICLPGDYLAYRLTGKLTTTLTGLSEGIFYDFERGELSRPLLRHFGFPRDIFPPVLESFDDHGRISRESATELGLSTEATVTYKAGDQPNNAFSLNVMHPGQIAATGGTSGVVYGLSDRLFIDRSQRVNSFAHVNHRSDEPR
ncbi:MAG: FGGY family carbohydrate kinase, partial [Saprospiraceae bacterium]|nr:FGGY family carbohydrate kinase [Saprospiraceae bacterium]